MINGVIAAKLQTLDEVLNELRSLGTIDADQLKNDWRTQRAVERSLQVLVEVAIDNNQLTVFEQFRNEVLAYVQED